MHGTGQSVLLAKSMQRCLQMASETVYHDMAHIKQINQPRNLIFILHSLDSSKKYVSMYKSNKNMGFWSAD